MKDYPLQTLYFGIANVIANGLVMLRCVRLVTFLGLTNLFLAPSSYGSLRTSRMIIHTTSPYKLYINFPKVIAHVVTSHCLLLGV